MHAGRFAHAAAAFCPDDGAVYVTENNFAFASGFYRYVPPSDPRAVGQVEDGGRLEALKVVGVVEAHLEGNQVNGATYAVEWVEIEEPFPGPDGLFPMNGDVPSVTNDLASVFVGLQGRALGAAHFSRIEGAVYARGEIYFTSMQGGGPAETVVQDDATGYGNGTGQVWSYNARTSTLTCRYQAPSGATLDLPDHITAKSGRGAILVCEDGPAPNHIRGLTRDAQLFDIALNRLTRNADGAPRFAEGFAGATFAPGTDTLYVNIEGSAGISFTIWGPWGRIGV